MVDQMRGSAMGFLGQENVITPNLDGFAKESTTFTRAVSNCPACTPARASLITGLQPLSHGLVNNDISLGTHFKTLAHNLNELDYKCGYVGKWHMDCEDRGVFIPPGPRRQGFDDFWAGYNCNHQYFDGYYYLNEKPNPIWVDGYEPFEQTHLAIDYIKNKNKNNEQFCLYVSYGPPHCPYLTVPQKYLDMYPENSITLKPNAEHVKGINKKNISGYYAHITALDECFGRLLKTLEKEGLTEDTIILFTSDHGDMLYSQDRGWKGKPWLESVNIPFIIRWPNNIPAGRKSDGLISLVDLMPTLITLVGGDKVKDAEGQDLSKLVLGDEDASPESTFISFPVVPDHFSYKEWRGILTKQYTYARFREEAWLLYDDINDPYQTKNLVSNPSYKNTRDTLNEVLNKWLERLKDPFETSHTIADKYSPTHKGCVVPFFENVQITKGKRKRRKKRNRRIVFQKVKSLVERSN